VTSKVNIQSPGDGKGIPKSVTDASLSTETKAVVVANRVYWAGILLWFYGIQTALIMDFVSVFIPIVGAFTLPVMFSMMGIGIFLMFVGVAVMFYERSKAAVSKNPAPEDQANVGVPTEAGRSAAEMSSEKRADSEVPENPDPADHENADVSAEIPDGKGEGAEIFGRQGIAGQMAGAIAL
jgi:hypothetical protein